MDKKPSDFYNGMTSILSISSKKIKDCINVAETMRQCGINCSITQNNTIIGKDDFTIENGCRITLSGVNHKYIEKYVWDPLKVEYDLNCAHYKIDGVYNGCIYNFIRESSCPSN